MQIGGAVAATRGGGIGAVNLLDGRVVGIGAERLFHRDPVGAVTVRRDLDALASDPLAKVIRRRSKRSRALAVTEAQLRHAFLRAVRAALQMHAPDRLVEWSELRRQQLDRLADAFTEALDLEAIFAMLGLPRYANSSVDLAARRVS